MKPLIRIRSITAPEKIEAVVAANRVKAAQNTPVALSVRFGPMNSAQGTPSAPSSPIEKPLGKAR